MRNTGHIVYTTVSLTAHLQSITHSYFLHLFGTHFSPSQVLCPSPKHHHFSPGLLNSFFIGLYHWLQPLAPPLHRAARLIHLKLHSDWGTPLHKRGFPLLLGQRLQFLHLGSNAPMGCLLSSSSTLFLFCLSVMLTGFPSLPASGSSYRSFPVTTKLLPYWSSGLTLTFHTRQLLCHHPSHTVCFALMALSGDCNYVVWLFAC